MASDLIPVASGFESARITPERYAELYQRSIEDPDASGRTS
jgi:hypothetical protein